MPSCYNAISLLERANDCHSILFLEVKPKAIFCRTCNHNVLYIVSRESNNSVAMLSHHLKELRTAIQCLGIKPKVINK